jgi:hypothetical protein
MEVVLLSFGEVIALSWLQPIKKIKKRKEKRIT